MDSEQSPPNSFPANEQEKAGSQPVSGRENTSIGPPVDPPASDDSPTAGESRQKANRREEGEKGSLDRLKPILKVLVGALVLVFLGLTIRKIVQDLDQHKAILSSIPFHWGYFGLAFVLYVLGLFPGAIAWIQTLRAFRQSSPLLPTVDAYFLGHLGKYVPGKAMVLVLRVGRLQPLGVQVRPAIISVFVETLTSICTGGIVGAILLFVVDVPDWIRWGAAIAVIPGLVLVSPYTFRMVLLLLAKSKIGKVPKNIPAAFTWMFMIRNCSWMALSWFIQGTAGWLVLLSLSAEPSLYSWNGWATSVAAVCLGAVAGFASMLPSGAVVRELVITWLLGALVTQPIALIAALAIRLSNIAGECLVLATVHALCRWYKVEQKSGHKMPEA